MRVTSRFQTALALSLTVALLRPPVTFSQQASQPTALTAKAAKATPAATPAPKDVGWPREITKNGAKLVYYQPQIGEWTDFKEITAEVAFSLTPQYGKETMGVASMKANTLVDKETRTVYFRDIQIPSIRFPSLQAPETAPMLEELFRKMIPVGGEPISVDRLMADVDRKRIAGKPAPVKNDPPPIFFSSSPAVLLMVEGEPVLAPVEKTDLSFVVNANWDIFQEKSKKFYMLATDGIWLSASDLKGPWEQTGKLPKDMSKLPANQNWDDVKKAMPPRTSGVVVPQVFYSDKPAELILLKGGPVYTQIKGTGLLYVANTDNDLFVDSKDNVYYVLISGRWFRAKGLSGPWTYAGNDLPADFAKIPTSSPMARVLPSVPGTVEASDAVMLAQIPTTAIIGKTDVESKAKVVYDGEPEFKPIEGTDLKYAVNTQEKVIQMGNQYYLCFQAVWLISSAPTGPWKVAESIPKEIYQIPPSSPVYNVTYVTQSTTATTVESSYTAGYMGMFMVGTAVGMTVAFGTGYYYPPYYYYPPGMYYPIYRPWPMTYGAAAVYNPWTGGYAVGHAAYGPYGAAGSAAWYNPSTGRYGRSASVQGWYGGRTVASAYNPWTGGYGATSQGHNGYAQWGQSAAVRGDQWARTGHISTANGTLAGINSSQGSGVAYRGQNGTIARGSNYTYAGNDGNVYRKDSSGNWSQYNNGGWNNVDTSAARQQAQQNLQNRQANANRPTVSPDTMQRLNQSSAARERGTMQMQQNRSFGGSGFGGGGFRGGGGRRR